MTVSTEVYPHAPLKEVTFEIRFPGEPAVECRRDTLYEAIRADFPKVRVPNAIEGQPLALQPYQFQSADEDKSLRVAINKFSFSTNSYSGYHSFKDETLRYMNLFGKQFRLSGLNRTGLRYINVIPITREDGLLPLERIFRLKIDVPPAKPSSASSMNLGYVVPTEGGSLTIRLESIVSVDASQEAFLLDFDYAKTQQLTFESVEEYLEESHRHTKEFFEAIISDEYRQVMRGEVIE